LSCPGTFPAGKSRDDKHRTQPDPFLKNIAAIRVAGAPAAHGQDGSIGVETIASFHPSRSQRRPASRPRRSRGAHRASPANPLYSEPPGSDSPLVKRLPRGFREEYEAFRERFDWLSRGIEEGEPAQNQLVYEQSLAFLDHWQGKIRIPAFEQAFRDLRVHIARVSFLLEAKYLETLAALLEQRRTVLIGPPLFEASVAFIKFMQLAPADHRAGLEKIFREHSGYDFDAERFYRDSEAAQECYQAEYRRFLARMEIDWAERFAPATRARLAKASLEEINQWKAEVAARLEAANAKIDKFAAESSPTD
jgi:hypothetical protein